MRSIASRLSSAISSTQRQLAALAEAVATLIPRQPPIKTAEEAFAVRQFLLAAASGRGEIFARDEPLLARLVERVQSRGPESVTADLVRPMRSESLQDDEAARVRMSR